MLAGTGLPTAVAGRALVPKYPKYYRAIDDIRAVCLNRSYVTIR